MRCLAADNEDDRERARVEVRKMLDTVSGSDAPERDAEDWIRQVLLELGVPDHILGHRYLVQALCIAVEEPDVMEAVTGELYPRVAKTFQTTPSRVERAIRHAVELAWERGDLDVMGHYFGNTVSLTKGKPTNSEFIARVANVVRQHIRG